jgi:hypothetical protein
MFPTHPVGDLVLMIELGMSDEMLIMLTSAETVER